MSFRKHSVNPKGTRPQAPINEAAGFSLEGRGPSVPGVQGVAPPRAVSKIYSAMLNFLRPFFARLFGPIVIRVSSQKVIPI